MIEILTNNVQLIIAANSLILAAWLGALRLFGRKTPIFIIGILLAFSLQMLGNYQHSQGQASVFANLRFGLGLLYGPFFYFYVRSLLRKSIVFKRIESFHFLPAFLFFLSAYWGGMPNHAYALSIFLSLGIYLVASWRMLIVARRSLPLQESSGANWIFLVLTLGSLTLALNIITYLATAQSWQPVSNIANLALFLSILSIITAFLLRGFSELRLISLDELRPSRVLPRATLLPEEANEILEALVAHITTDKPYLDPDLSLDDLARRLRIPARKLSQVVNVELSTSIPNFINGYRVREAQARLTDPAHEKTPILNIGLDVGFNSKASFNRVFKNMVGVSPTGYRRTGSEPAR